LAQLRKAKTAMVAKISPGTAPDHAQKPAGGNHQKNAPRLCLLVLSVPAFDGVGGGWARQFRTATKSWARSL